MLASGGPERDLWSVMHKRVLDIPAKHRKNGQIPIADRQHPLRQYLRNTAERGEDEAQYFAAQTCAAGAKWLEDNRDAEHFLLWLELFDPHEPFDPPKRYLDMYRNPAYRGPSLIAPWFHSTQAGDFTPEELEDINALYNAEITHLDHWVGVLLDKLEEIGRAGDTAVVFVSDHGTLLGERGYMGKNPTIGLGSSRFVCNQPLIVRHPHGPRGKRIQELVWSPDYMPTCCEMLGVEPPPTVHGRSFWPLIQGVESAGRPHIVAGWHKASLDSGWSESTQYVVDAEWSFLPRSKRCEDELYSRRDDPNEAGRNLAAERPEVCERLRKLAHEHLALANSLHA
ncbi:MAG: Arylsulfatase [candidate division BRC1 bacterium ADurb.BinA364]|nr:MAG: Arylsulfatase [candidate division BRC1 bacterium ADurb.BinA364]